MSVARKYAGLLPPRMRRRCREIGRRLLSMPSLLARNPDSDLVITLDMVLAHYKQTYSDVCFLQIGAFDGVSGDALYPLVGKYNLRGILVEPQKDAFARLKANYPCNPRFVLVNAAIGAADETVPLYRIKAEAQGPEWLHQIASFDRRVIMKHAGRVPDLESCIEIEPVPCLTFASLYKQYGIGYVDLLQIDAEGYDAELLRLFDVGSRRPAIVRFEHKHLGRYQYKQCLASLITAGYRISATCSDTLAYLENPSREITAAE